MPFRIRYSLLPVLAIAIACTKDTPLAPMPSASLTDAGAGSITAMTRNLYIGADVHAVIHAPLAPEPSDDFNALLQAITVVGQTACPLRAEALADEIARSRPQVVGLQEVSEIHINIPPLGIAVNQDFLAILMAALNARGLHYALVGESTNLVATPFAGVAVTDHDALLRDADRASLNGPVIATIYAANLGHLADGIDLNRGYVVARLLIDGRPVTVATTHLEPGNAPGLPGLRAPQAQELGAAAGGHTPPTVLGQHNDSTRVATQQVGPGAG